MSSRRILIIGFLLSLLTVALLIGRRPQKCAYAVCENEYTSSLRYGAPGAHTVGTRLLTTGEEPPLEMRIWYPTSSINGRHDPVSYPYPVKIAENFSATIATTPGTAFPAAPYDRPVSPYPLVILSPGFATGAAAYSWLAEHLAAYGFVVIAPEHREHMDPGSQLWRAAVTRPQDIQAVFTYVDTETTPGGELAGVVDGEVTALIGHSYGGYTALTAAGARIDTAGFQSHCTQAVRNEEPAAWLCEMLTPHLMEMAELAGLAEIPAGLWPDWSDGRVDAIVPIAGDAYFFGTAGLAEVDIPLLAIGGTADADTPFNWGPEPAFAHSAGAWRGLVGLQGAEHMIFTNPCTAVRWYARPLSGEFCADAGWERQAAHELTRHLTTAFLLAELHGDSQAAAALSPERVKIPAVTITIQKD